MCECDLCKRGRYIRDVVASRDPDRLIALVHELSEQLLHVEFENEGLKLDLSGGWPKETDEEVGK